MKKYIKLFALIMVVFMATGCNSIGTKVTTCTLDNDQSKSGYKILSTYKIYSKKDVVKKVEMEETLTSKNTTILAYFEKIYNARYKTENSKYKGITYNVKKEDGKLITRVTTDYNKLNMTDYIKANSAMNSYVNKDKKFTLEGAKTMYESIGAKCN